MRIEDSAFLNAKIGLMRRQYMGAMWPDMDRDFAGVTAPILAVLPRSEATCSVECMELWKQWAAAPQRSRLKRISGAGHMDCLKKALIDGVVCPHRGHPPRYRRRHQAAGLTRALGARTGGDARECASQSRQAPSLRRSHRAKTKRLTSLLGTSLLEVRAFQRAVVRRTTSPPLPQYRRLRRSSGLQRPDIYIALSRRAGLGTRCPLASRTR